MSSAAYTALIRELARDEMLGQRRVLTCPEMATVIREFRADLGDMLGEHADDIATSLEHPAPYAALAGTVALILQSACRRYIETDVREMRLQIEEEDANEDAYTRGVMLA